MIINENVLENFKQRLGYELQRRRKALRLDKGQCDRLIV